MNPRKITEYTRDLYPHSGLRVLFAMISATIPIAGKIKTYTSGCARNQKRCCQSNALPPPLTFKALPPTTSPLGRKKLVPAMRSIICITPAASNGGNASTSRNPVTNWAHTKNGSRIHVSPFARNWMMVVIVLTEPRSDEVIRNTMPVSHKDWPVKIEWLMGVITESGAYEVQPECAEPPDTKKMPSMTTPPIKYTQQL